MCCTRLAEDTGRKNDAKNRYIGTIEQLCRAISSQLRHLLTIGKKLLNSNISSTCPLNMVNFGLLTAEICGRVWGTPANFNGFRVLAALLHGALVVGVSQTLRLNSRRHRYSAGPPSRWTLAHTLCTVSSFVFLFSSPNLSGRKLDVYHTSTHGVALERISNADLKCAARGSLEMQDPQKSPKIYHLAPSHNFARLYLRN